MLRWTVLAYLLHICYCDVCPIERYPLENAESRLVSDILCDYNYSFRPVKEYGKAVTIKVRFILNYLTFNYNEESVTVHSRINMLWKDDFLSWNPDFYSNITYIPIESSKIWTPPLYLFNADPSSGHDDEFKDICRLNKNGMVNCAPKLVSTGLCQSKLAKWPYDTQECTFYFGSWMHTGEEVNFTFFEDKPVVLDDYQNGPGWKLINTSYNRTMNPYNAMTFPMLILKFQLERLAAGYAALVVVPTAVLVVLTLITALLDINDNTRLMVGCFSLYSHCLYLDEIGYNIPKHSTEIPTILLFLRNSLLITLVTVVLTLILMWLRKRSAPAPRWVVVFNRILNTGPVRYAVFTNFQQDDVEDQVTGDESSDLETKESRHSQADWLQVANSVNSCFFIIVFFIYVGLGVYIPFSV